MKIIPFILSIAALSAFAAPPPTALLEAMRNPPNISESTTGGFTVPEKSGAILIGPDFISYISLLDGPNAESSTYKFRTYSTTHKLEIQGEGEVFEKYYRVKDPASPSANTTVVDKGSKLEIDTGLFRVTWSASRHLYVGKGRVKIQAGTEAHYLKLIENEE